MNKLKNILLGLLLISISCFSFAEPLEKYFENTGVRIIDDPEGTSLVLSSDDLFSKSEQAIINPYYHPALIKIVEYLKEIKPAKISIYGYTDTIGDIATRIKRTEKHAMAVANYLLASNISSKNIISVKGQGSSYPITDNLTTKNREINRRVEILIHPKFVK